MRKLIAAALSLALLVTPAKAFAPVAGLVLLAEGAGASVEISSAATALVTLVGSVLGWLKLRDINNGEEIRVPLTNDPALAPPAPTAPATASPNTVYTYGVGTYATPDEACQAGKASLQTSWATGTCQSYPVASVTPVMATLSGMTCTATAVQTNSVGWTCDKQSTYAISSQEGCPAGYGGSPCTLTDARLAVSDNSADYKRTGVTVEPLPDADSGQTFRPVILPDGRVQVVGVDDQNRPKIVTVTPRTDGGSDLEIQTQTADLAGNSVIRTQNGTVSGNGTLSSGQQTETYGSIAIDPATGTGVATSTGVSPQNATAPQTIQFPNDYARIGEAGAAAQAINDKLDSIYQANTEFTAPALDNGTEWDAAWSWSAFDGLNGWTLPAHASSCPTASFSAFGQGFVIDEHCALFADHAGILYAAMVLVWTIGAVFIVLRA